jgi:ribonuclease D
MPQKSKIRQALAAARQPVLLESESRLMAAAKQWKDSKVLGIDTEFIRERTYRADLGLVQISDGQTAWLADPVSLKSMQPLSELMKESKTTKILHSGSEDLEVLQHALGAQPDPLVDTQIACAMLGQPLQLGYHHAVKWLWDIEIDKDQTRSRWLRRPLSDDQKRYAAVDVVLLPMMLDELKSRLIDNNRWSWLEEDVSRMKENSLKTVQPEDAYLRLLGHGNLDEVTLRVLQALAAWREKIARTRNLARGFVISDIGLKQLARLKPAGPAEIQSIEDLHPGALARYQDSLLHIIADAQASEAEVAGMNELNGAQKRLLNSMRQQVRIKSEQLAIDPALLASRRELEKLIRAISQNHAPPERFLGWRKSVITDELLE